MAETESQLNVVPYKEFEEIRVYSVPFPTAVPYPYYYQPAYPGSIHDEGLPPHHYSHTSWELHTSNNWPQSYPNTAWQNSALLSQIEGQTKTNSASQPVDAQDPLYYGEHGDKRSLDGDKYINPTTPYKQRSTVDKMSSPIRMSTVMNEVITVC